MNPYFSLLQKSANSPAMASREARLRLYEHARRTLVLQLSTSRQARSEFDQDLELRKLEEAIAALEASFGGQAINSGSNSGLREPRAVPIDVGSKRHPPLPPTKLNRAYRASLRMRSSTMRALRYVLVEAAALLTNPWVLFGSLFLGVYLGLYQKRAADMLAPVADVYLELLKMVLLPFMISAIVVSLSRLFGSETMTRRVGPILTTFVLASSFVAFFGIATAVLLSPGQDISASSRQTLGQLINRSPYAVDLEIALDEAPPQAKDAGSNSVVGQIIPENIFHALTVGDNLKILFFAIAFGVGLGSLRLNRGEGLRTALLSVYDVCTQIIAGVNLLLPVALCAMVAKQVANVGAAQLLAMLRFTVGFGLTASIICLLSIIAVALATRVGLLRSLVVMRQPALVAIATRSSISCIPAAVDSLIGGLGFSRSEIELVVPLGVTLFRFGPILYYAFTTVFVAQLYGISLNTQIWVWIFFGSLLTGLASAGTTGVLTLSLIGVIFQPLGLPLEAALALLVTIDPIIDIFRTITIVLPNCAAAAIIYRNDRRSAVVDVPAVAIEESGAAG